MEGTVYFYVPDENLIRSLRSERVVHRQKGRGIRPPAAGADWISTPTFGGLRTFGPWPFDSDWARYLCVSKVTIAVKPPVLIRDTFVQ